MLVEERCDGRLAMRTAINCIAIICTTFAALELVNQQYIPAALLAIAGIAAFVVRGEFRLPGEGGGPK
jgi:hypothetical protein